MNVTLLSCTPAPLEVIATAARQCHSVEPEKSCTLPEMENYVGKILDKGHLSILEHVSFSFSVKGISRICSHQLVRHRIASYSQVSQRYTKSDGLPFVTPRKIKADIPCLKDYREAIHHLYCIYERFVENGIPIEDARYILPQSITTNIILTMNARELYQTFFPLRCCRHAQWEIRALAYAMLKICRDKLPAVFNRTGSACKLLGYCPEHDEKCFTNTLTGDYNDN